MFTSATVINITQQKKYNGITENDLNTQPIQYNVHFCYSYKHHITTKNIVVILTASTEHNDNTTNTI